LNNLKNLALWIVIAVLLVFLFNVFQGTGTRPQNAPISYSRFTEQVVAGQVKNVTFQGDTARGELTNGQPFATIVPDNDPSLWPTLKSHNVDSKVVPPDEGMSTFASIAINAIPDPADGGLLDLHHAPDAVGRRQGHGLRQEPRQAADRAPGPRDIRGCRRRR
jgi:ATP-dependent Zn protease